jgi:muramoyltetrapeptide carboxypeptidase
LNKIKIIRPAGKEYEDILSTHIDSFNKLGIEISQDEMEMEKDWPYASSSIEKRINQFHDAFIENESDNIVCARGGYGASDLLPLIDWDIIKKAGAKHLVGFSDISALHAAFYSKFQETGNIKLIHAPMPSTSLWDFDLDEVKILLDVLIDRKSIDISLNLNPQNSLAKEATSIEGKLFGGCFSVLTNLIGTDYMPNLDNHILFFEDIGEHPARLMRYLNQWIQSGILRNVKGIVLGYFKDLGEGIEDNPEMFLNEFSKRIDIPVWHSDQFGHIEKNMPIKLGETAHLQNQILKYKI